MKNDLRFETLLHQKKSRVIQMQICEALKQPNNADIIGAVNKETHAIEVLIKAINSIQYPEVSPIINIEPPIVNVDAPTVNVEVHQQEVINCINSAIRLVSIAQTNIIKLMGDLLIEAKRLKETEFSFTKDKDGEIQSPIIARQIK